MSDPSADVVLSVYFGLVIDNVDLGIFSSCDGLGIDMQVTQREDGGGERRCSNSPVVSSTRTCR